MCGAKDKNIIIIETDFPSVENEYYFASFYSSKIRAGGK
jgi:hypothetical protein